MVPEQTYKTLIDFRNEVVNQAKQNLSSQGKNTFGNLSKALDNSYVKVSKNSFEMAFTMPKYGEFQDKGVSGVKEKYDTPFSYKSKGGVRGLKGMPPPKAFDKWVIKKGIAPRDKNGKFISREGLKFAIAKKIFLYGIKPSLFFTKPFEDNYKKFIDIELEKAFALDVEKLLNYSLK
jgi:hypothetical protein